MAVESRPTVGPYRLRTLLGRGGMAAVYGATRQGAAGFSRPVCLKLILPYLVNESSFRSLFVHEARVSGTLVHGNLVQVFDCVQDGTELALVMELVDGLDLRRLLQLLRDKGHSFPSRLVVQVAGQVLAALNYVHGHDIVHRDITPHNIMISRAGEVKLADFGVAKAAVSQATGTGTVKGKLAYMSPEQASGGRVDARTDLFSLGLVLFELLTGRRFFDQKYPAEIVAAVGRATPPELPTTDPDLARVVVGLLQPDRERRLQTAAAALAALPTWRESGPWGALQLGALVATAAPDGLPLDVLARDDAEAGVERGETSPGASDSCAAFARRSRWAPPVRVAGPQESTVTRPPRSRLSPRTPRGDARVVEPQDPGPDQGRTPRAGLDETATAPWVTFLRIAAWLGIAMMLTVAAAAWAWSRRLDDSRHDEPIPTGQTTEARQSVEQPAVAGPRAVVAGDRAGDRDTQGSHRNVPPGTAMYRGGDGGLIASPQESELAPAPAIRLSASSSPRPRRPPSRRGASRPVSAREPDNGDVTPQAVAADVNPFRRQP